jgi:pseudouridine-5'-phosphate glycosidase
VFKNRTHAVTFRLAESEFEELTKTAVSQGARSLSDFARAAVMTQVALASGSGLSREEIESIAKRLDAFDLTLKDLKSHVLQSLNSASSKAQTLKSIPPRRLPH